MRYCAFCSGLPSEQWKSEDKNTESCCARRQTKEEGIRMLATFCLPAAKFGHRPFASAQARWSSETGKPRCPYRLGNRSNICVVVGEDISELSIDLKKKKWRPSSLGENLNICLLFFFYFKRMLIYTPGARLCDWYCWNWWLFCTYELCESFCRTQRISKSVWNETFFFCSTIQTAKEQHNLLSQNAQTQSKTWFIFEYILRRMCVEGTSESWML